MPRFSIVAVVAMSLVCANGCLISDGPVNEAHAEGKGAPVMQRKQPAPLEVVPWNGHFDSGWKEFDRLMGEQKFEAASGLVEKMLATAKQARNSEEWTRCLIKYTVLRMALHGYEASVRFLKEQPWPEDLLGHTVVNLYYQSTLVNYAQSYSWEINQREKVESKGPVDLKAWTMEQIYSEAQRAFEEVWRHREQLGQFPVSRLNEFIRPNTFPEGVRPTLRDAVSYMRAQLLGDSQGWRPEDSNEIFTLDVRTLLGEVAEPKTRAHPLSSLAAVLSDLEGWHQKRGERAAAFEAHLERLRSLHQHFTEEADRAVIRADLRERLKGMRDQIWWSMGMALLAEFTRDEKAPDNLVRAHAIARQGREAFPNSVGGQRCLHIEKGIEQPSYQLAGMATDGLGKRSLDVSYQNLTQIHFRAYPIDIEKEISASDDYDLFPSPQKVDALIRTKAEYSWSVKLEATTDYKQHRKQVTPEIKRRGMFLVVASTKADFTRDDNHLQGVYVALSDVVLVTQQKPETIEVMVLSGATGQPLPGATVTLYRYDWQTHHKAVEVKKSDSKEPVRFRQPEGSQYFLFAKQGDQVALDLNSFSFYRETAPQESRAVLLFTDRAIYRPGQKILWKAVAYKGRQDLGKMETLPASEVTISLYDGNHQQVEAKTVTTNAMGTAAGEFAIPPGRLLGNWSLRSAPSGGAAIRVEEYKRPTFEVKLLESKEPLRLNKPAMLRGEARFYFGLPVTMGTVRWRVQRTPVYPWWWGYYWRGHDGSSARTQTVATGKAELQPDGRFSCGFTPSADERRADPAISYRYQVTADVTDEGGETRTAERAFRLGFVAVEAGISLAKDFLLEGSKGEKIEVRRSDLDGTPAPGSATWRLVALDGPRKTLTPAEQPLALAPDTGSVKELRLPGDLLRQRWSPDYQPEAVLRLWADGAEKAKGRLNHDAKGQASVALPPLAAGAYRIHYETKDAYGATYQTSREFVVANAKAAPALPLLLKAEASSVPVGATARLLVASGLEAQPMYLDLFKDGKRYERRRLTSGTDASVVEIAINEADRGGFGATLWAVRDHQYMQQTVSVFVPWDNKSLKVEFGTFRDLLRPGGKEKWTVKVTGPANKDVAMAGAEVLAYMYDRSLDVFANHSPPSPLALYPNRSGVTWPRANLGQARQANLSSGGFGGLPDYPYLNPDTLQFYSGYGIGGPGARRLFGMKKGMLEVGRAQAEISESAPMGLGLRGALAYDAEKKDTSVHPAPASPPPQPPAAATSSPIELRSNFSETAFWQPQLLTGADGTASFEFTVPDSVTSWNVWAHAVTNDFRSGQATAQAKTVKDLMVRPYLPRFLREGDQAEIKVVINNASNRTLEGLLDFDIIDPATDQSVVELFGLKAEQVRAKAFVAPETGSANVTFKLKTPAKVGTYAFKVTARSGDFSDGELRPIPVLPGRMHLAQSRFKVLKGASRQELTFKDLAKNDDPSLINEQMVVTLDGQLFYSVLSALPYLVNYPYECVEQTLNRFVSTGIMASLYGRYPAVEKMAAQFSQRKTQLEQWDAPDPNRKMALEETPWVIESKGGGTPSDELTNVLDPRITKATRDQALSKLQKAQTSAGGFPWFPGGPPSTYITLYLLHGFSKAVEFGVDVPKDVTQRAWSYLHRHYIDELVTGCMRANGCWEFVTFLNYVLSNYPDASWSNGVFSDVERKQMLDFSFRHWKQHSPYLKGYLALTLKRLGRAQDANLVWESVMDSAKESDDEGTHWAAEDRSWLWYNDTIETHAFAIRTTMELTPKEPKLDGMVLWVFLNKKLNHWKSTRATAEVIYSLAHYLKATEQLGIREEATVSVGNQQSRFVFEPDTYTGKKNQILISGDKVDPKTTSTIVVEKPGKGYMFASATWQFSTEKMPAEGRGDFIKASRMFFKREQQGREVVLKPLTEGTPIAVGDEVEVQISLTSKHPLEYVHLRDPRAAGFEPVTTVSSHKWDLGLYWYEEVRDSGENFFFEQLPQGEYTFKYRLRATTAGTYKVAPATVQPMYAPEFTAYTAGTVLAIRQQER